MIGLAPQPAAADRAAAEREETPRIVERRQDRLLDLIERHVRPATRCGSRSNAPGIWRMLSAGYSFER